STTMAVISVLPPGDTGVAEADTEIVESTGAVSGTLWQARPAARVTIANVNERAAVLVIPFGRAVSPKETLTLYVNSARPKMHRPFRPLVPAWKGSTSRSGPGGLTVI